MPAETAPSADSDPAKIDGKRGSLLVIFLTVFIDLLGFGLVLPLLPIYAKEFFTDAIPQSQQAMLLGLLMASFSAMQFVFAPLWGRLSDRIGRRPVVLIGLAGSVIFYTLFGVATVWGSYTWLLVSRIGAGIAGATISIAAAYIADTTTLKERPRGMALIGVAFGLGFTLGPLLGILAVPVEGQPPGPWPGYVAAILSAFAFLLAVFKLPESLTKTASEDRHVDLGTIKSALATPSIAMVVAAIFITVFSFAAFETTLSLLIKKSDRWELEIFDFSWVQVCYTYAFIGLTLALVQGGVVRRVAGKVHEGVLCGIGAVLEILGLSLMIATIYSGSLPVLLVALMLVVSGFAFLQPSLNSLLSRRSDPRQQGSILGVGQSSSALARIIGSAIGIPMLVYNRELPYMLSAGMMVLGLVLITVAVRVGKDYGSDTAEAEA
jgi:DHA1 family tetracycline resistance protein-like MFS transporter